MYPRLQLSSLLLAIICLTKASAHPSITLTIAVGNVTEAPQVPVNCTAALWEADAAIDEILVMINDYTMAFSSPHDFDVNYCQKFPSRIAIARRYKECLAPFPKEVYSLILSKAREAFTSTCGTEDARFESYDHLRCLTHETKPHLTKLEDGMIAMLDHVTGFDNLERAVGGFCCGTKRMYEVAEQTFENTCTPVIGHPGTGPWVSRMVRKVMGDAVDMMCANYQTLQVCQEKVPDILHVIQQQLDGDKQYNHSVVIPLIRLVKRLDAQINIPDPVTPAN